MRKNMLKEKIRNGESAIGTFVKLTDPAVPELLALAGAWFLFPDAFSLERWMEGPARIGSLLFGFVIPVLLLLVKKLRRQV